jgi:hypothetical protein
VDGQNYKERLVAALPKPRLFQGYIAIFDVLGFKSFCQNNTDQKVAEAVLGIVDSIPEVMRTILGQSLGQKDKALEEHLLSPISWLVFSDTIVVALPQIKVSQNDTVYTYLIACSVLNRLMFDHGLPVRGAIYFGDLALGNRCIAGKVVVEALEQVHELELACTVVSNDAWTRLQDSLQSHNMWSRFILGMLPRSSVPCKNSPKTLTTLNWFNVYVSGMGKVKPKDYYKYVMDSFLAHGKQLNSSAHTKARNTADLFDKWESKPPVH